MYIDKVIFGRKTIHTILNINNYNIPPGHMLCIGEIGKTAELRNVQTILIAL